MIKLNIKRFAVTSGTLNSSYYYTSVPKTNWYIQVNWWVTATGSNYHTIKAEFYAKNTNSLSSANYCYLYNYKAVINGSTFGNGSSVKGTHGKKLGETTITIYHTGEQSFNISCEGYYEGKAAKNKVSGSATFTLPALIATPTLAWNSYSAGSETSINFSASITSNGNAGIVNNYVDVSTTSNMGNIIKTASSLNSAFTGLSPNTTYYLRARASNGTYTGYSSVVSVTTWANPSVKSISAWNVGSSTTIQFNNPHGRTLNWYIKSGSTSGTTLASGTTNGSSVTVTPTARDCWSSITSGNSKTAYLYFTCANPNITSGSVTATYTLQKVNAGTMTVKHSDNTNNTYAVGATNVTLTLGDSITIPISSNASKANYKWFIETPDGQNATYGDIDTSAGTPGNAGTTTQTISAATIQSIITNYFTAQMASDVATQGVNIGIATLNGNNSIIMNSEYFGNIKLTNSQVQPTFSNWEYYDSNTTITGITGDNQILIQNASYPALKISTSNLPTPRYGGTLSYIVVALGSLKVKYTPQSWSSQIVFDYQDTIKEANGLQNVTISVYDNRGAHTDVTKQIYIVPYIPPVDKTKITRKNSFETETTIKIDGNYSSAYKEDGTVYYNSITGIRYRYKLITDENYGSWTTVSGVAQIRKQGLNESEYTAPNIVSQSIFNNNNQYSIQIEVTDTFGNVTVNTIILDKGVPILFVNSTSENVGIGSRNETGEAHSLYVDGNTYTNGNNNVNGSSTVHGGETVENGAATTLILRRTGGTNAASVRFDNTNGMLGAIGMTGAANGKLIRWNKDYSSNWEILDRSVVKAAVSAKSHTDYNNNQTNLPTMNFLTYWNGAYNSSNSSNLTYAHQGTIQCKPTNLYNNSTGTTGTVTLSQTAANFTYLAIYYYKGDNYTSQTIYSPNGKKSNLAYVDYVSGQAFQSVSKQVSISGTSITTVVNSSGYGNIYNNQYSGFAQENMVKIVRVDGYK